MDHTLAIIPDEKLKSLSSQDLLTLIRGEQSIRQQLEARLDKLQEKYTDLEEQKLEIEGKFITLKKRVFTPSTEKSTRPKTGKKSALSPAMAPKNCLARDFPIHP